MKQKLHTQEDLLKYITKHGACREAREYVESYSSDYSAKDIWSRAPHYEWLIWLGMRRNVKVALAWTKKTLDRVERIKPSKDMALCHPDYMRLAKRDYAFAEEATPNSDICHIHIVWSLYESHRAAPSYFKEARIRLDELRLMW